MNLKYKCAQRVPTYFKYSALFENCFSATGNIVLSLTYILIIETQTSQTPSVIPSIGLLCTCTFVMFAMCPAADRDYKH